MMINREKAITFSDGFFYKKTASNHANSYALDHDFLAKFRLGL